MKLFFAFCLLLWLALPAPALEREAFTVSRYDLEIRLDPPQQRLGARGTITLRNDSTHPEKIVALQISSSLNWRSIRVQGKPVQFVSQPFTSDIDHTGGLSEAIVTLPAEVRPKETVTLEVGYEGVVPLDATRLTRVGVPDTVARHTSWDQISPGFTAVRGAGFVAWYPITTESADFSDGNSLFEVTDRWNTRVAGSEFKVKISLPGGPDAQPIVVCSSGARQIVTRNAAQEMSVECSSSKMGTVTPAFVVAGYHESSSPPLRVLSLAGHEEGAAKYSNALEPATKFVRSWFGTPAASVIIADLADPNAPPFETGTLLLASMAAEDSKLAGMNLVHELVHSALPSSRPWVYEGLAHFAEALYRQQQGGRQAALDFLGLHRAAFLDAEKELSASPPNHAGQALAATFDEAYYRSKAAYVWWMLRDMVGDQALQRAIAKYKAEDDVDPGYVEKLIAAGSQRDLTWFFDDWVYHDRGLPDFHVQSVHPWKTEKGVQFITVTLENLGNAGAEVPFTVLFEGGEITNRIEVRARSTATMRVQLPQEPGEIRINDGSVPESDLANNALQVAPAAK
jgi:hypothetical protein